MALIIRGKSQCAICGNLVRNGDKAIGFPAFVWNLKDKLLRFNDAVVHERCLADFPGKNELTSRIDEFFANASARGKSCRICNKAIASPTDHISLPHLTSDKANPLYKWNYAHLHKGCWRTWPGRENLKEQLAALSRSDEWAGNSLNVVLASLVAVEKDVSSSDK